MSCLKRLTLTRWERVVNCVGPGLACLAVLAEGLATAAEVQWYQGDPIYAKQPEHWFCSVSYCKGCCGLRGSRSLNEVSDVSAVCGVFHPAERPCVPAGAAAGAEDSQQGVQSL